MGKPIKFYDDFLEADGETKNMEPALVNKLADDIDLELYLVPTKDNPKGYARAVIAVKYEDGIFRYKYDSGRVGKDPQEMLEACLKNINFGWDLNLWRKYAMEEYKKQSGGFLSKLFRLWK